MSEHTKEPWRLGRFTGPASYEEVRETVGNMDVVVDTDIGPYVLAACNANFPEDARANASRIVACVNLLAGHETEQIEGKTLEQYIGEQAFISGVTVHDGFTVGLNGLACQLLAASFAGQFKGSGAINYLEVSATHPDIGAFTVTIQRNEGKTPHQLRVSAEQQRDVLLAALNDVLACIDVPEKNCCCHISPPCNDCVENGGLREVIEFANAEIAKASA